MSLLPPPNWLNYDQVNKKIMWEDVVDADSYQLNVKPQIATEWSTVVVDINEYAYDKPVGAYEAKVKTGKLGDWGQQSRLFEFTIE